MKIFNSIQLGKCTNSCGSCAHFQNDPTFIEAVYPGLTTMSSGYASVRDKDGLCSFNQLYLSARDTCTSFTIRDAYTQLYEANTPSTISTFKTIKVKSSFTNGTNSKENVMAVLSNIEKSRTDITESYEQWFQIGCALANEFGEEGREMFHNVSMYNAGYNFSKANQLFKGCLNNGYGYNIGTFFYWVDQYNMK